MDSAFELLKYAELILIPVVWYVRLLTLKIDALSAQVGGVSTQVSRMSEENSREHGEVAKSVMKLEDEMVREMRGVIAQHSDHDKQNTRIETKVDILVRHAEND